jgi:seryl-tRNA synthetase
MHDPRTLLDPGTGAEAALARRGYRLDLAGLRDLVRRRAEVTEVVTKLRAESNRLAKQGRSAPAELVRERAREVKEQIQEATGQLEQISAELTDLLLTIPNLPAPTVPAGLREEDAVEVRVVGGPRAYGFQARHHADVGEATGILDLKRAAKIAGARFAVTRGAGAALERAVAAFCLDLHTREHGYTEHSVPSLVNREAMTGTGQLPKFADDLFRTTVGEREMFLIPTAEVPLTNLYAGETLDASVLPLALTAHTPCYRGEAGSYGRDSRGILRVHEFSKVELVRLCAPENSERELEIMVGHVEECLIRLGLAYRVVLLAAGDMGFSARTTYDIEVWLPGQNRYREISSCSDCGTFQARRAGIRLRTGGGKGHVATLNGSGLPIGRTLLAILEQYQRSDGGVDVPEALVPYTGFASIAPDGTPRA